MPKDDPSDMTYLPPETDTRLEARKGATDQKTDAPPSGPVDPPPNLSPAAETEETPYCGHRDDPSLLDRQEDVLTDENRATMKSMGDTAHGRELNTSLREGRLTPEQEAEVAKIDDTFHMTFDETTTVYRGIHSASDEEMFIRLSALKPGDVIYDRGYQSATPDIDVARSYAEELPPATAPPEAVARSEPVSAIFEIEVPASTGTRVAYLDRYNERGQVENTLPRDSLLEYKGYDQGDDGFVHVRFEYVQEGIPGEYREEWPTGQDKPA
jgi:hypothetical protein